MRAFIITTAVVLYVGCGVLADGMWVGSFQTGPYRYNSVRADVCAGLFAAVMGPVGLMAMVIATGAGEKGICFTEAGCKELRER